MNDDEIIIFEMERLAGQIDDLSTVLKQTRATFYDLVKKIEARLGETNTLIER